MALSKRAATGPIVHIMMRLYYGGAEMLVKNLATRFVAAGRPTEIWLFYRAETISPGDETVLEAERVLLRELEEAGVVCRFLDKQPGGDYLHVWKRIRRLAKELRPALVHLHLEEISFHGTVALTGLRVPLVQTIHSTLVRRPQLLKYYFKRRHKRLIAISHEVMQVLADHGITEPQAVYIRNGIETKRYASVRDSQRPVRQIISVASLTPVKNHALQIRALGLLRDRWLAEGRAEEDLPQLRIVGEGPLRSELEDLVAELDLKDHVELSGVSNQIPEDLAQADIFSLASDYEGISIAIMEAMASQLPITVTNMTGAKELIRRNETGTVVEIGDHAGMAQAWYELITEPERRLRYAQNVQADVAALDIAETTEAYLAVYDGL